MKRSALAVIGNPRAFLQGEELIPRAGEDDFAAERRFEILFQRLGESQGDVLFGNMVAADGSPVFAPVPGIDDDASLPREPSCFARLGSGAAVRERGGLLRTREVPAC